MWALASISSFWSEYVLHTMHGVGYQWWSGPGSDIGQITLITAVVSIAIGAYRTWRKKNECHVTDCHKIAWHVHPTHGHPVCKVHHPHGDGHEILDASNHTSKAHAQVLRDLQDQSGPGTI